ncbi:MAG: hypothetical protein ACKVT0_11755 [Planctomycetaceae bacterium]
MSESLGLLDEPPQPEWWRDCSKCRGRKTLVLEKEEPDDMYGMRRICRCTKCHELTVFFTSIPDGCI